MKTILGYSTLDIFRPSISLGQRQSTRLGEKFGEVFLKLLDPLLRWQGNDYRAIKASSVARAMVEQTNAPKTGIHLHLSGKMQYFDS